MNSYKDHLAAAMEWLGEQEDFCAVGYNICQEGGSAAGTMDKVPLTKRYEMPVAEALMTGVATGLSLDGRIPLIWFERMDFMLHAADQIVNHLDKLKQLSGGFHQPACIIRVSIGNSQTPLFSTPVHTQDLTKAFQEMVSFPIIRLKWADSILSDYKKAFYRAKNERISTICVEYRDLYGT